MKTQLDHLVVIAPTLAEGARWCEDVLGLPPGPGGEHPLMGTHNRLLRIASPDFAQTYLEIIAINPGVTPERRADQRRWFDMDDARLSEQLARKGPQLAHWVARTDDVAAVHKAWLGLGIDRGEPLAASRMTPQGLLEWRITVRDDGARLFDGCLPTLIQWGDRHPAVSMADHGFRIEQLRLWHPEADRISTAWQAAGGVGVAISAGAPRIEATLATPRGAVVLKSA